jgi:hypothetical protein
LKVTTVASLLCIVSASASAAESLDLADCDVLFGKKDRAAFGQWISEARQHAEAGQRRAKRALAGVANNTMACQEEEAGGGDSAWSISVSSEDENDDTVVETQAPMGIPDIQRQPAAMKALREVIAQTHSVGQFDPGYRALSAEWVLKYAKVLPELLPQAYEDAAGAYHFDCVAKGTYGKRLRESACADERHLIRQLSPLVPARQRETADRRAAAWARTVDPATSE